MSKIRQIITKKNASKRLRKRFGIIKQQWSQILRVRIQE